jgi:hypothetical protein
MIVKEGLFGGGPNRRGIRKERVIQVNMTEVISIYRSIAIYLSIYLSIYLKITVKPLPKGMEK